MLSLQKTGLTLLGVCALSTVAMSQQQFAHIGQFAQFRNMSGLPGGTFGVTPGGDVSADGAMAMSTPVAYSLSGGHFAGLLGNTSYNSRFRIFSKPTKEDFGTKSNGTLTGMAGISTPIGNFTVGMTIASGSFENFYNALYEPKLNTGKIRVAVGAEGLFAAGGLIGPGLHSDTDRATSYFGVATAELGHGVFASAGIGNRRFANGFFNLSCGLGHHLRATVEHDGYDWNYGVGGDFGAVKFAGNHTMRFHAFAGFVQTRYAFWSVGFSF